MKIKKGDKIKVLAGKDRGKSGKVLQVFPSHERISVEGINLLFKNMRSKSQNEKGQRIQFPAPFSITNAVLICPACNRPTRVGYKTMENKKRVRFCRKCNATM